ncbi:NEQ027 [Nanoarchaeum equitans Kin4-M]|uniref:NEQ027 n=1 Tax=Nanoarchaeum equitans (strain Kin4-M) TaxID=228908 RepID=Q74MG7_NANEQ|nr:NEQ027 [Nanoarchaeum equitans Kin4-M]
MENSAIAKLLKNILGKRSLRSLFPHRGRLPYTLPQPLESRIEKFFNFYKENREELKKAGIDDLPSFIYFSVYNLDKGVLDPYDPLAISRRLVFYYIWQHLPWDLREYYEKISVSPKYRNNKDPVELLYEEKNRKELDGIVGFDIYEKPELNRLYIAGTVFFSIKLTKLEDMYALLACLYNPQLCSELGKSVTPFPRKKHEPYDPEKIINKFKSKEKEIMDTLEKVKRVPFDTIDKETFLPHYAKASVIAFGDRKAKSIAYDLLKFQTFYEIWNKYRHRNILDIFLYYLAHRKDQNYLSARTLRRLVSIYKIMDFNRLEREISKQKQEYEGLDFVRIEGDDTYSIVITVLDRNKLIEYLRKKGFE